MTNESDTMPQVSSPIRISFLEARQASLLAKLELITDTATHDSAKEEVIDRLRAIFNSIVDEEIKSASSTLSDPMIALPRDLWPNIIQHLPDESQQTSVLLDLIMVSQTWFSCLTSFASLWSYISLNHDEEDCVAKAAACLHFSGSCKLRLEIRLSLESWHECLSLILPQSNRIYSLTLGRYNPAQDLDVLAAFGPLPSLEELILHNRHSFVDEDFVALQLDRMPNLRKVLGPHISIRSKPLGELMRYVGTGSPTGVRGFIRARGSGELPNLQEIFQNGENSQFLEIPPNLKEPSLLLLQHVQYEGPVLSRCMGWMGHNLTALAIRNLTIGDFDKLLDILRRSPSIYDLSLGFSADHRDHFPDSNKNQKQSLSSTKILSLDFSSFSTDWTREDANVMKTLHSFIFLLTASITAVERLTIMSLNLTEGVLLYIQSLNGLCHLNLMCCEVGLGTPFVSLQNPGLEIVLWGRGKGFSYLLAKMKCPRLRILSIDEVIPRSEDVPTYSIRLDAFPALTKIDITSPIPALWDIGVHTRVEELELRSPYAIQPDLGRSNELLEYLIMKPRIFPALDTLVLRRGFYEWDILILMLERRNSLLYPKLSPIKAIVVDNNLPYELSYPLAALLQGRLPKRPPINFFSIETIGQRLWDDTL
jgi:hypothetical protein